MPVRAVSVLCLEDWKGAADVRGCDKVAFHVMMLAAQFASDEQPMKWLNTQNAYSFNLKSAFHQYLLLHPWLHRSGSISIPQLSVGLHPVAKATSRLQARRATCCVAIISAVYPSVLDIVT